LKDVDHLIVAAVKRAAKEPFYGGPQSPEANLVAALRRGLAQAPRATPLPSEESYDLDGWTRLPGIPGKTFPGGVDLVADLDAGGRILIEAKRDKPWEALWDAIKLADIIESRPSSPIVAAYLIYDGTEKVWRPTTEVAELFLRPVRDWRVLELIAEWPNAWLRLLGGGRGIRPRDTVMGINFRAPFDMALGAYQGRVLRVLRVIPQPAQLPQHFDPDGWPIDYDPPSGLREAGRAADQALLADVGKPPNPSPAVETDECHGYPWYSMWTTPRIADVLKTVDAAGVACLRNRLKNERNWPEWELQERFDPLIPNSSQRGST
jgi:hypothetical protein